MALKLEIVTLLRNVGKLLLDYTASHPKRSRSKDLKSNTIKTTCFCLSSIDATAVGKEELDGYLHSGFYRDNGVKICGNIGQADFCLAEEGGALHYTRLGTSF
jgi:hypothetical protein